MKISKIEAFPVKLQFKEPFVIANVVNYDMFYVIVKLTTDEGITGYGEAIPAWEVTGETQFSVIDVINHFCEPKKTGMTLINQDISTLENVKELLNRISPAQGVELIWGAPSAKAAIEEAILDAYGKYVNKPIYEIFGAENRNIQFTEPIGIFPVYETLKRINQAIDHGAKKIKIKVGVKKVGSLDNYDRDVQVIKQARDIIKRRDPSIQLFADANQGYVTPEKTIEIVKRVEGCLDRLEQPILANDKLGFKIIKEACDIQLVADESVQNFYDAKFLIESGSVDAINLKLMKTGGMLGALRIADLAEKHGVKCIMGSMLENKIGCAIAANVAMIHKNIVDTELNTFTMLRKCIGTGIDVVKGSIVLSNKPGIGIDVDEREIKDYLISAEDSLTLRQIKKVFDFE